MLSPPADAAPRPLSPAQIASITGQALLSEQSNCAICAWVSGGPWTNKNEHPAWSDSAKIIVPIKLNLVTDITPLLANVSVGSPVSVNQAAGQPAAMQSGSTAALFAHV
jgi:hypothetical protein